MYKVFPRNLYSTECHTSLFAWINVTALSWTYFLSVFFLLSCIFISWQDLPGNKERREKLDYRDKQVSTVRMVIITIVITTIFTKSRWGILSPILE